MAGTLTFAREVQPRKALWPMNVMVAGMLSSTKRVQPSKARWPMMVSAAGRARSARGHSPKAAAPMMGRPAGKRTSTSEVHAKKAASSSVCSFEGRCMLSKLEQQPKAPRPMLVSAAGSSILVRDPHVWKA